MNLNQEQKEAIYHEEGPLLIFAGAGSGKTRVITNRIERLITVKKVDPKKIVALSFTNKSAKEMRNRLYSMVGKKNCRGIELSTFHSFGLKICKEHIERIGYKNPFTLQTPSELEIIINDILKKFKLDNKAYPPKMIISRISFIKNGGSGLSQYDEFGIVLQKIIEEYSEIMRGMNAIDFDDLILKPIQIMERFPDVVDNFESKYRYIMVDEFQDTNESQYRFIKKILGKNTNLCVVGDDDQSIYGFRGSNKDLILNFEKDFPSTKVIKLMRNYRSSENILKLANSLIRNNSSRKDKELISTIFSDEFPQLIERQNEKEEAGFIVDKIQEIKIKHKITGKNIAILFRTNYQSRPFEEELRLRGVPYKLIGAYNFFDRKEVKDLIAYLRVIANHKDDLSLLRIINYPKRGLGQNSQLKIIEKSSELEISIYETLLKISEEPEFIPELKKISISKIYELVNLIQNFNKEFYKNSRLSDVLKNLIKELKFDIEFANEENDEKVIKARMLNLSELVNMMVYFEMDWDNEDRPTLFDFLLRISLLNEDQENNDDDEKIQLMTIHLSKGLEFDTVFISGLEEGILPSSRNQENEGIEEERRLFYVGITRAKKRLFITRTGERKKFGEIIPSIPSRFLTEIDSGYIQKEEAPELTDDDFIKQLELLKNS